MDNAPLVSIVIPVYNGANYLQEAIESALGQTYKNIEIIVVNDGSNDHGETKSIALQFKNKIKYIEKENGGVSTALNIGIKEMKGEYFSWLSHDDIYYSNKIEEQVEIIKTLKKKSLVWSNYDLINSNSQLINKFNPLNFKEFKSDLEYIIHTSIHGCSLLIPKSAFLDAGYFDTTLKTTQDNHMWIRMLEQDYSLYHMNQSLIQSRQHEEQGSITLKDIQAKEKKQFYKWIFKIINNQNYKQNVLEFIQDRIK